MEVNLQTMQAQLGSTVRWVPSSLSPVSPPESSASGPTFSSIPTSSEAAQADQSVRATSTLILVRHESKCDPVSDSATDPLTHADASELELGVKTAIRNDVELCRSWSKNEYNRYNGKSKLKFYEYYCASCGALHKLFVPPKWTNFHCRICDRTRFTKNLDEVNFEFSKAAPARKTLQEYCAGCGNMQRVFGAKMMGRETKCKICGRNKFVKRMKELPWIESSLRSRWGST